MKIGFIGYGNMAEALGSRWTGKHDLFVGDRDATKARVLADKFGHSTMSGSEADAAVFAEVVVLATRHAGRVRCDACRRRSRCLRRQGVAGHQQPCH